MGIWRWLAEECLKNERPRLSAKAKRQFFIDAEESRVWDIDNNNGRGSRDIFTIELSKWLYDRPTRDVIRIDELVGFLHDQCVYLIRKDSKRKFQRKDNWSYKRY